jgi:uncharacterized protein YqeY
MEKLKTRISADYMAAFKAKNTVVKNLLSVIKGEIQTLEKNTSGVDLPNEEVIKILNKTLKSLKEIQATSSTPEIEEELRIIESYLPKMMTEDEIRYKINELVESGQVGNIADLMRAFANLTADRKEVARLYLSK